MAKGYWIANSDVFDTDALTRYRIASADTFARYGAKFLVTGGTQQAVEGTARSVQVVIEFPSHENAVAAYHDPMYQEAAKIRRGASNGDLVIVEGNSNA